MPSQNNLCQARGVRVVGYLASGPTGAAILVLRQQVLITAKLRGRHSIFLFGVIAASPCCTWYAGRLTEVRPSHRLSAPSELYLLSPQASILSSCQLACVLSRWSWHAASLGFGPSEQPAATSSGLSVPLRPPPLCLYTLPVAQCSCKSLEHACQEFVPLGPLPQSALSGCRLSICKHLLTRVANYTWAGTIPAPLALLAGLYTDGLTAGHLRCKLRDHMEGAAWFMSPSRAIRLPSHLLHSASANIGILTFTLPGIPGTRHYPRKHTRLCHVLFSYPGTGKLQPPRHSPLASIRLRHPPPMGRAHYRPGRH